MRELPELPCRWPELRARPEGSFMAYDGVCGRPSTRFRALPSRGGLVLDGLCGRHWPDCVTSAGWELSFEEAVALLVHRS